MTEPATGQSPGDVETPKEHNAIPNSVRAHARARTVMPGGTTRVTIERVPVPLYVDHGSGAFLIDIDGNRYLDFNNNYTTLVHGHVFEPVVSAVERQLRRGTCFSNPTEDEITLAEIICARMPVAEKVRFVTTGTEAVMFAIKAARAITGREKVAKFEGAFHGAYDWAEISQSTNPADWSGPFPASVAPATGTPRSVVDEVVVLPFNDVEATTALLDRHGSEIACVLIDLAASRLGLIAAEQPFLIALRDVTRRHGILVIDDEVLNFRQGYHGAAGRFGLEPDLLTLGKIIGGGMPIGAVAGPAHFMAVFDSSTETPALPQGGTFAANPLSVVAGVASMRALDRPAFDRLDALGDRIRDGLRTVIAQRDVPFSVTGLASLFRIHPKSDAPRSYREAHQSPSEALLMKRIAKAMLDAGVFMPSATTCSLSTAMTEADIDHFVAAFDDVVRREVH